MPANESSPDSLTHDVRSPVGCHGAGRVWLIAVGCAGTLYLLTMAPGVLWGDSGDAQVRVLAGEWTDARELARTHITYYAAAIGLHRLGGLDAALAANIVSALAGAITVANVCWLLSLYVRRRLAVVCGGTLLLVSHTLWQLSTGAEVVTFSTMFLSFELVMVTRFAQTLAAVERRGSPGANRDTTARAEGEDHGHWLALAALANGIGWSTHNCAMLSWPAYLVVAAVNLRRLPKPRVLLLAAGAWMVGCLPLIVVIGLEFLRLGSVNETIGSLLFGVYRDKVLNYNLSVGLLARQFVYVGLNFPTPLILLSVWGWWRARADDWRGLWLMLTVAALTYAGFALRYNVPDQYTFWVHAYLFAVLFTAIGLDHWLDRYRSRSMRIAVVLLTLIGPVVYAVAPPLLRNVAWTARLMPSRSVPYRDSYAWLLRPWRTGYRGAERYAREVFAVLPPEAVLLAGDTVRRPLDYIQGRDGIRPDVRLPYRPRNWRWRTPLEITADNAESYARRGLLFCTSKVAGYGPAWLLDGGYRFEPLGHVYRVLPPAPAP